MLINPARKVTFTIKYKTDYGQNLYLIGSTPELGNWKEFKQKMKWTEDHIWTTTITISDNYFEYKYAVKGSNNVLWEQGPNRICVLDILPDPIKIISYWESYTVRFIVYYPLKDPNETMCILGDIDQLGNWYKRPPVCRMRLGEPRTIMNTGQQGKCWETELVLHNSIKEFGYKYAVYNEKTQSVQMEREVGRYFKVSYEKYADFVKQRELEGKTAYEYNKAEILINGLIERNDANVAMEGLLFDEVLENKVFVGPYPQTETDILYLKEKSNIKGIFNLQTERDFKQRTIDITQTEKWAHSAGMEFIRFPINDFDPIDLAKKLIQGANELKNLIDKVGRVYVHCTAGMGRASAITVMYMTMYENMDADEACNFMKMKRKAATPNMKAVKIALEMLKK